MTSKHIYVLGSGAALLFIALLSASPSALTKDSDARFKAIYTKEWAWRQAEHGDDDEDSASSRKGVNPWLPKADHRTEAERLVYWTNVMKQLDAVERSSLSPGEQTNYDVYRAQIQVLINGQVFHDYEKPLTADTAFWSNATATARKPFLTVHDYNNFLEQMSDMRRYFDEEIGNMRAGLERGFTPPKVTLAGRDISVASVAEAKSPEDTVFYAPFKKMPANIPPDTQAKLQAAAVRAIRTSVIPAYATLLQFMRTEYIPGARTALDAESLPQGKAYYQAKILEFTTTTLTPEEIHQIGLDEGARIHAEMLDVMKQTGFQGDFSAFLQFLRADGQFYAKTPDELLARAAFIAKQFDGQASRYFGYLPRQRFGIIPVPADIAPFYTSGRGGPGEYLVNTYDLPSRPLYSLPALTLHESAPGHAFQMPIALEHKELPDFRRVYISAYGEGWALYCERLGTEMGIYRTPYETFGMLSYQAWRAARLVVDTGIHAKGWTREQGQNYLREHTALSNHEIETEVDRYIAWPGQALSYYLGEMEIVKARRKAESALRDKFNIRAFHDAVLALGCVPLPVLAAHIDELIAKGGRGPYPDME